MDRMTAGLTAVAVSAADRAVQTLVFSTPESRSPMFWCGMGPLFADRAIRRELPGLYDLPGRVWFVTFDRGSRVLAFGSVDIEPAPKGKVGPIGHLRNLWVDPARRGNGLASALMEARLAYLRDNHVPVARTSRKAGKEVHFSENHGFRVVGQDAGWEILEADLTAAVAAPAVSAVSPDLDAQSPPDPAYLAGYAAAERAIKIRTAAGKKFSRVHPRQADFRTYAGDPWPGFVAGWTAAVRAYYDRITSWSARDSTTAAVAAAAAATTEVPS